MTTETTTPATEVTKSTTTMLVIASGTTFPVPIGTDHESIKQALLAQGFADVASATIQTGTKIEQGVEYDTVEFVKRAGTKGLDGAALAGLLTRLSDAGLPTLVTYGPTAAQAALLTDLHEGLLTFDQMLGLEELAPALEACYETPQPQRKQGAELCTAIDHLSPVAAAHAPCGW